jgi:hypothetical protein
MFFNDFKNYYQYSNQPVDDVTLNISVFESQFDPNEINTIRYIDNNVTGISPLNFKKNFTEINDSQIF